MSEVELRLSWMLWLCVGFLIGYRYHVMKVRDAVLARAERMIQGRALDQLLTDVAIRCIEHPTDARVN